MSADSEDVPRQNEMLWSHYQGSDPHVFEGATARLERLAKEVGRRARHGADVLTIGIGNGVLERRLRDDGCRVSALDPDASTVERLRADGFTAEAGLIEDLPFADATFDAVVASEVLEHLTQQQADIGLTHVRRVLRPGGWFIGTVPYNENLDENRVMCPHCGEVFHRWGHCRRFDEKDLAVDLGRFFEVVHMDHRAFVSFRGRSATRMISGGAHWALGRLGSSVAFPNIFFVVRRSSTA